MGLFRGQDGPQRFLTVCAVTFFVTVPKLSAVTYEIFPSNADLTCDEEFENLANQLEPGDELILHGGIYTQSCRRAISANGTRQQPITIRAATGERPVLTRPADNIDLHNNIEVEDSSYLILDGLTFEGGSVGVRFIRGHHVALIRSEISQTGANALSMNSGDSDAFFLVRNHIHDTGLSTSGQTEGEGMYIGCNDSACRATNSLIEGNYIHHLRATSGGGNDGIEIKVGSGGNVVRNNVIHDTTIGTEYPCIFVYGRGEKINRVEGNAMWNCGEAIQVSSDAIVANNLILNSSIHGITASRHGQVDVLTNTRIVNNTIYGHPKCLYVRWSEGNDMVLANNAVYCPGTTAVDASGLGGATIDVRSNYVEGGLSGATIDGEEFFDGGSAESAFVDPSSLDFWPAPGSRLRGAGAAAYTYPFDFNATTRTAPFDVGAYETEGLDNNPCWRVAPEFKTRCETSFAEAVAALASPSESALEPIQ